MILQLTSFASCDVRFSTTMLLVFLCSTNWLFLVFFLLTQMANEDVHTECDD